MLAEPIDFQIVTHLQAALQAISVETGSYHDVAAGAVRLDPNYDVDSLIARATPEAQAAPRPFVILDVHQDQRVFIEKPDGLKIHLPLTIHWINDSDPTDDQSFLRTYLRACADIERAISIDRSRGQLAMDTLITNREYGSVGDGAQVWAKVDVDVEFYRTNGQP